MIKALIISSLLSIEELPSFSPIFTPKKELKRSRKGKKHRGRKRGGSGLR
tara:strand:- start:13951 stop:14100 length:150 start_codon:yes stop_codon:yes gene_type:complete